jgi:hypothetical protein
MAMTDLLRISIDSSGQLLVTLNGWVAAIVLVAIIAVVAWWKGIWRRRPEFEISEVELGIGQQKVKLKPSHDDLQVAYKLWVELRTRKLGLPFSEDYDVIADVYNSWYEFFKITRELIKSIPASRIARDANTRELVSISVAVLNHGIRPHLTKWQARFRRWYEAQIRDPSNVSASPQELQRNFPQYPALVTELKETNARLVAYAGILASMVASDIDKRIRTSE